MASPADHHSPESGVKEVEGDLVLEFGRRLKANFEREAGGKESDGEEEKCSDGPEEPSEQVAELQSLESCGQTGAGERLSAAADERLSAADERLSPERSLTAPANTRKGPRLASSKFRGCTRHRRTKRYEAHIWDQRQQRYLGGFDREVDAGKAHDVMALKCRVSNELPQLNFPMDSYTELIPLINRLPKEEVVAQLRQLNRTAPRPKARKAPIKSKSASSLAGLTTRSGIIKQGKRRHSSVERPSDPFGPGGRLAGLSIITGQQSPRTPRAGKRGCNPVKSAFACQKDLPLPPWDYMLPLDCPMSPDLTDALNQLADPSDLLSDAQHGMPASPALSTGGVQTLYRSPHGSFSSSGPLYMGKAIGSPRQPPVFLTREQLERLDAHCLPEPLHIPPERLAAQPPSSGKSIHDLLYPPSGNRQAGRYLSTGFLDGSYTHSGGSARNSLESDSSHFGGPMDRVSSFGQQPPPQRQPAFPWDTVYHGQTTPKHQQPFRCPSLDGYRWAQDSDLAMQRSASTQMLRQLGTSTAGWADRSPTWPSDLHSPQTASLGHSPFKTQASFNSSTLARWDKSPSSKFTNQLGLSDVQPPALDGGAELRQPGIEQQGMSFTQLLTQDLPTAEQLDSAVMDAMGSWSP